MQFTRIALRDPVALGFIKMELVVMGKLVLKQLPRGHLILRFVGRHIVPKDL